MLDGIRIDSNGAVTFRDLSGQPVRSQNERTKSFEEEAVEDIKEILSSSPTEEKIFNAYRADCFTYVTLKPTDMTKVALTPQDYVCSKFVKKIQTCTHTGVFYKDGKKKIKILWKNNRFCEDNSRPIFLSPATLQKELKKVFADVELTLGELCENNLKYIAWMLKTEIGVFYILWHNGLIAPLEPSWVFTPKSFKELKSTYKVLRFTQTLDDKKEYRITCG